MESQAGNFRRRGMGVAALSYDSVEILKTFAERKGITYTLLSDPDSKIIRAFGVLNESVPAGNPFYGIPHPVTFLVDESGVVRRKYFEQDYRDRYTATNILEREFGVTPSAGGTDVKTRHLALRVSATDSVAGPGARTRLLLDVALPPGMHVYAPGVEGYIPIDWKMSTSPAWTVHDVTWPPSQLLNLPAINETVPVYAGSFRLARDLTVGDQDKLQPLLSQSGELTVEGSFRYQACDDKLCYPPQTVPLKWVFAVQDLDKTRVPAELRQHLK